MSTKIRTQQWETIWDCNGTAWKAPTRRLDLDRMNDRALRKVQPTRSPIRPDGVKNVVRHGLTCGGAWVLRRVAGGIFWVAGGLWWTADWMDGRKRSGE